MKLGLVIATYNRPDILQKVITRVLSLARIPDELVISAVNPSDVQPIDDSPTNIRRVYGSAGSCCQRNRGLSCLLDVADIITFIDDDFIVGDDYFANIEAIFARDRSIIGLTGHVVADGANSPGYTFEEGLTYIDSHRLVDEPPTIREIGGTYGCNMAFRTNAIRSVRFDERLPLYGWQEDLDFSGALRGTGRIVTTNLVWGVHLGTKRGKGSEVRLGYSQIINPAYIVRKGNMSLPYAIRLATKNVLANLVKSAFPEPYVDRRGRLRGNMIGIAHLITGRFTPEYVLDLK
jgi:GT2 family glycosyltransferase